MNPAPKKVIEIDGRPYEATIFYGDGKKYDVIRAPHDPLRAGTFLLRQICPILETVKEANRNVAIIVQPVEIRTHITPKLAELALA